MIGNSFLLKVSGLYVRRETCILDNINWKVCQGEQWCLLGANGSGKTTLLNTICAYFSLTDGSIELLGRKYGEYDWTELRKRVGLVGQSLAERMRASQKALDVVFSGKEARLDYSRAQSEKDINRCLRIMSWAGAGGLAKVCWGKLSQGERQRVLICRALMADYRLLILDEPCAGLDPVARSRLLAFLATLVTAKRSPAIIMVTHHVEEIIPAITHVLLLKKGRVLAAGRKSSVLNSTNLSAAFDCPVRLIKSRGGYRLELLGHGPVL